MVEETLISQVRVYVHQHLHDPALGPDTVAGSLAVSRRQLFRVCQRAGFSLEQYIIARRLEGAKADLATPAGRARTIAASANRWGFKDPTHFSRRFKAAYGMLPRDWRASPRNSPADPPVSTGLGLPGTGVPARRYHRGTARAAGTARPTPTRTT